MTTTEESINALGDRIEDRAKPRDDKGAQIRALLADLIASVQAEADARDALAATPARAQAQAALALVNRPAYLNHASGRVRDLATWILNDAKSIVQALDATPHLRAWLRKVADLGPDCWHGYSAEVMAGPNGLRNEAAGWPGSAFAVPAQLANIEEWKVELAVLADRDKADEPVVIVVPTPTGAGVPFTESATTLRAGSQERAHTSLSHG